MKIFANKRFLSFGSTGILRREGTTYIPKFSFSNSDSTPIPIIFPNFYKGTFNLEAISPIDGRYLNAVTELKDYFSEYALMK